MKLPPLSYSGIKTYKTCPKQFYHKYIVKDVVDPGSDASRYGTLVHKVIEDYLRDGTPIPEAHRTLVQAPADAVKAMPGTLVLERKMAVNWKMEPCDFFAPDVFLRGVADVSIVNGEKGRVLDWKGLPLDTEIPTPGGFTTMEKLEKGDFVFGGDGLPCRVIGKSQVHNRPCFRIDFDDKTSVICDDVHLWKLADDSVVPVTELKAGSRIPIAGPLELTDAELPIDPYVFGLWLADGTRGAGSITKPDSFIWEEVQRRGYEIGSDISGRDGGCPTRTVLGIRKHLTTLGVLYDKYIPDLYLFASKAQRLDLLRGLLDGDGNVNEVRKQAIFTTCDKRLSDNVKQLAESLGQRVNQATTMQRGFGLTVTAYPLAFRPQGINPFLLPRKADRIGQWGAGNSWYRKVVAVVPVQSVPTQCIAVDSADNTYLCTRNFIPTHNTGRSARFADPKQLELMAIMMMRHDPNLQVVNGALVFLIPNTVIKKQYKREEEKPLWREWLHEIRRIEVSIEKNQFGPSPNNLCGKWCPVHSCNFNGRMLA